MSESKKLFSAREAAQAVLAKAKEIVENSELMKAEKLRKDGMMAPPPPPMPTINQQIGNPFGKKEMKKYEPANNPKPGVKYGPIETNQKAVERDYQEYEVKPGSSKDSNGPRVAKQVSPSGNPKEAAEGNNKPDGMEPKYEFKDKVKGELEKENAAAKGNPKDKNGNPGLGKAEKLEKGDWKKIHDKLEREGYSKKSADKIDGAIKAKMGKNENPDKEADAQLGEKVEHDVEDHMKQNAAAEQKEGHSMAKPGDKSEVDKAAIPRLIVSAKLSKFMEHMHSKRKNAEAQAPAAVGNEAANAPAPGSTQAGQPDPKAEKGRG